jgi:hypothetical protein
LFRAALPRARGRATAKGTVSISVKLLSLGACGLLLLGNCRPRPSSVPLGGVHEPEQAATAKPSASSTAPVVVSASSVPSAEEDAQAEHAEEVEVAASSAPSAAGLTPGDGAKAAAPAPFQVKPYALHQAWTRLVDLEFNLKVGPGGNIDMKMVSHQETRFEVLAMNGATLDKLSIEYPVYTSKLSIMGGSQDSPEELAGKRFVVSFNQGKPDVRDAAGGTPPKKQVDSVKDDAREPLEIEKALRELSQLTAKGKGDFSAAGALSLAGGEDDDTRVTGARGSLQRLVTGARGEKSALVELSYTLSNAIDDKSTVEVQVAGSLSVLDGPARYQTSVVQGPMELRSSEAGGMAGRGTIKVTTSYRY